MDINLKEILAHILESIYPVGSIFISTNSTSPADIIGGTWERIQGRFLLGATDGGATGTDIKSNALVAAGSTGGEAAHIVTIDEMPSHTHQIREEYGATGLQQFPPNIHYSQIAGESSGTKVWVSSPISYSGGGQSHNTMPPFISVYMWKRVA